MWVRSLRLGFWVVGVGVGRGGLAVVLRTYREAQRQAEQAIADAVV